MTQTEFRFFGGPFDGTTRSVPHHCPRVEAPVQHDLAPWERDELLPSYSTVTYTLKNVAVVRRETVRIGGVEYVVKVEGTTSCYCTPDVTSKEAELRIARETGMEKRATAAARDAALALR
jgi:hypothetical protein